MADNLEVNFTAAEGAETQGNPARVFSSEVVRVNRGQTILEGEQLVAVTFE